MPIFIIVPRGIALDDYSGLWIAKDMKNRSLITRKNIVFEDEIIS